MNTPNVDLPSYRGYRFPTTVISHCVWLYFRFSLSYRDVEEMMAERGVVVSYETIQEWCQKFGQAYAKRLRARRGRLGDRWHLDEVFLRINGRLQYLWRAVDQDGEVLDILVQRRRSKQAAKKFFRKLLKGLQYIPRAIITDKLRIYPAAMAEVIPSVQHQQQGRVNNRAKNFWRLILTGRSCTVASHNGANLRASNLSVGRQSRSPTSSLPSRPLFASIPTKLTIPRRRRQAVPLKLGLAAK